MKCDYEATGCTDQATGSITLSVASRRKGRAGQMESRGGRTLNVCQPCGERIVRQQNERDTISAKDREAGRTARAQGWKPRPVGKLL